MILVHTMKHRNTFIFGGMLRILICIVIGLVASIGVALCAASWLEIDFRETSYISGESDLVWLYVINTTDIREIVISQAYEWDTEIGSRNTKMWKGPWWSRVIRIPTIEDLRSITDLTEVAYGWPMYCLSLEASNVGWSVTFTFTDTDTDTDTDTETSVEKTRASLTQFPLPTTPIWIGLVVDTMFFASIPWLLLTVFLGSRCLIRKKRGQCVYCAYIVRDLHKCPECGRLATSS